ncbi:MAG: hypothetical protein WCQ83_03245, partial [Endomicrobiia bacterium]
ISKYSVNTYKNKLFNNNPIKPIKRNIENSIVLLLTLVLLKTYNLLNKYVMNIPNKNDIVDDNK